MSTEKTSPSDALVVWGTLSQLRARPAGQKIPTLPVVAGLPWIHRDAAARTAQLMLDRAGVSPSILTIVAIEDDLGEGPVTIWNEILARTRSSYFLYCAEDAFAGRAWLNVALQAMQQPGAGLLAFNDGKWFGQLAGFGLVRRPWLESIYQGRLFHPGYVQHYGDTELTLVARQQGALVYHPHAMLVEVDHAKDGKTVNDADRALFAQRAAAGFDGLVRDPTLLASFR